MIETIIAIVIAVASPALAWVISSRMFEAKVTEWRQSVSERLERIERAQAAVDLAAFRAMDTRREYDWVHWRQDIEARLAGHVKGQADWRHQEYAPEARRLSSSLAQMQQQIADHDRRIERVERKVFNGGSHA